MSASSSRPILSPKNIPAITSGSRKKHGQRRAHGLDGAAPVAARRLSRLHAVADARAGRRPAPWPALGHNVPALLPSLLLLHSRAARATHWAADGNAPGAVRRQSRLLSRHHDLRLADRRLVHRQERSRALAAVRLARETAAFGLCRPPGTQRGGAARQ